MEIDAERGSITVAPDKGYVKVLLRPFPKEDMAEVAAELLSLARIMITAAAAII